MSERALTQTQLSPLRPQTTAVGILQRACACGGNPGASGDCEECRRKRLTGRARGLQARLAIGQPGDRWEQDADRAAEAVVAGGSVGAGSAALRNGPPGLHRTASAPQAAEIPAGVQQTLDSPGRPLDARTRGFMESRFGYDFGRVRVHDDPQAASSARRVNALAYTVGQDVVFGAGQFAPHTLPGRKLLAHELAHTLQQQDGAPRLRRKTGPFTVDGLYEKRGDESDFVFFDRDQPSPADVPAESVLDGAEQDKIKSKAAAALANDDQEISLYGFASEEGIAADNSALVRRRMTAVQDVLQREGFAAPRVIHTTAKLDCSSAKYDYRFWRAVEMQEGAADSTRVCEMKNAGRGSCDTAHTTDVNAARDAAKALIEGVSGGKKGVRERLDAYIKNAPDEPALPALLDRYFGNDHSATTARAVRDRVQAIWDFLDKMGKSGGATVLCGSDDEPTCHAGSPASASHASQEVIVCPMFFDDPVQKAKQDEILVHEASHGSKFSTDDRAYQKERVILILSTDQALQNAQSLTMFIMDLNGRARPLGPDNPDKVGDCDPQGGDKNEKLVREALAWAQRWNTYAKYGTAQTYGNEQNTTEMTPYITAHFGRADRAAIAALYDRYKAMDGWFDQFFNVRCAQAGDADCAGTLPVRWNLTKAVSPSGGGPVKEAQAASAPQGGSASTAQGTAGASGSSSGTAATTPAPASGSTAPAAAPAGDIAVCPGFFKYGTLYDRTVEMYAGLAANMPGVSAGLARSYPRLAYNYKTEFWKVK